MYCASFECRQAVSEVRDSPKSSGRCCFSPVEVGQLMADATSKEVFRAWLHHLEQCL